MAPVAPDQLVLVEHEQQLLVEHEQQLEHEQLELDAASSTDSSVISSISNVALSSVLSSSLNSADMAFLPSWDGCAPGTAVPRTVSAGWARSVAGYRGVLLGAVSRTVPVTRPRADIRSVVVVSVNSARTPPAASWSSTSATETAGCR